MQIRYFSTAWRDITSSPKWFGKVLLLALVACIPVFGLIVFAGYAYGWARDIAWRVQGPLPERVFGNEDGRLYSRGFFALVIALACSLAPWVIDMVFGIFSNGGPFGFMRYGGMPAMFQPSVFGVFSGLGGLVFFVLSSAAMLFAALFAWVGALRMSIYGRLCAGFQFGKIWSMIRHDIGGIFRIVGMTVLMYLVLSIVLGILISILVFFCVIIGIVVAGGGMNAYAVNSTPGAFGVAGMILSAGGVAIILSLVVGYAIMCVAVLAGLIIIRSMGYWVSQFDVPAWRGQDDPMPFELTGSMPGQQPPYHP